MSSKDLIPVEHFCKIHRIEVSFIQSLNEHGLLEIVREQEEIFVASEQVGDLEKLVRLHYEMDINLEGLEAITNLLDKMESLQQEIRRLQKRLDLYE